MSGFAMALFLLSSHSWRQGWVLRHPRTSLKPSNPQTIKPSNMGPCTKLTTRERPHSEGMLIHARPWRRNLSFRHIRPLLVQSQSGQPCKGHYIPLICLTKPCPMGSSALVMTHVQELEVIQMWKLVCEAANPCSTEFCEGFDRKAVGAAGQLMGG